MHLASLALLGALAGCPSPTAAAPLSPTDGTMVPRVEPTTVDGPSVADAAALLTWLESGRDERRLVQLPVTVELDGHRVMVKRAWIGATAAPPEGALHLALDDSALGVALIDRLRAACPEGAPTCAVWLEGRWGALIDLPPSAELGDRHPFSVLAFVGLVEGEAGSVRVVVPGQ